MKELSVIQQKLKAPKSNINKFGGYNYRSCEDILEAVKPLLGDCTLVISDTIEAIGGRVYVKATATISDLKGVSVSTTAYARETEDKKGMDSAQITGAASSYARKYALNGLFAIDDTKDADATNDHGKQETKTDSKPSALITPLSALTARIKKANDTGYSTAIKDWMYKNNILLHELTEEQADKIMKELDKVSKTFKKDGE